MGNTVEMAGGDINTLLEEKTVIVELGESHPWLLHICSFQTSKSYKVGGKTPHTNRYLISD